MATYTPRRDISGTTFTISSDFTGSDGASNRTYVLSEPGAVSSGMSIIVNGASLQSVVDYTFSGSTITFLGPIYNSFDIQIDYFTTSSTSPSGSDTEYATTLELVKHMSILGDTIDGPSNEFLETVGTGDNSKTIFLLDHKGIVSGTYSVYYGASAEASLSNELTETTHYSLDKDTGKITLAAAGVTAVGTNTLFASYNYNTQEKPESELQNALNRAAARVDSLTENHFTDGTSTTPNYESISDEEHDGRGLYNRNYFSKLRPVADVSTQLNGALSAGATSITVDSTQGFPESGTVGIDSMKILYTGKTSTTFTGCSGVTTDADDDSKVYSYVFEASNTIQGATPSWTVLAADADYNIDFSTGRVYFMASNFNLTDAQAFELNPPQRVPGRFRMSYLRGESTIPDDVKLATLMLASNDLMHGQVRKATVSGMDNFTPAMVDVDLDSIKELLKEWTNTPMGTTP